MIQKLLEFIFPFKTLDAEIKHLREHLSALEVVNQNLREQNENLMRTVLPQQGIETQTGWQWKTAAPPKDENWVVAYFVPYDFEYTEFHNGGNRFLGRGMTVLNIEGGITGWDNIMNIQEFVTKNVMEAKGIPNPMVRINNVTELSRWQKTETAL